MSKKSPYRRGRERVARRIRSFRKWLSLPARLFLVRTCSRLGLDGLNVRLLLAGIEGERTHPGELTVLCLDRQNFSKDIAQLRLRTRLNWLTLRHRYCGWVQVPFTPLRMQKQMFHWAEHGPDIERAQRRADRFFRKFIRELRTRHIDAVMSANSDYWQDEAFRRACLQEGFPFLVLSREHYITPAKLEERVRRYRESGFQYVGAGVAVFGQSTVETMIRPGVCPPGRIRLTGAPRLDQWRDRSLAREPEKMALLISFARWQYGAQACSRETLREFAAAANRCADRHFRFVVKCKNEEDRQLVLAQLAEFPSDRVQLLLGADLIDLLSTARAVIGFNSLALLEALLGSAAIAVPNWKDAAADPQNRMLDPGDELTSRTVDFINEPAELGRWLDRLTEAAPEDIQATDRRQLLKRFFHFPTELTCSEEVARFVKDFTEQIIGTEIS